MIPYILDDAKSLQTLAADKTNGLGALPECLEAVVTQERNGAFTLRMKVPMSAKRYPEIKIGGIVKAKVDDDSPLQMFRISKISRPISGIVTVDANHISYDLGKTSVMPFTSTGAAATMRQLKNNMIGGSAFTFQTEIDNASSTFSNTKPQSLRALLGGQQGSVLDVFGGEYVFDNLQVILKANRGNTTGIELRYGKNITDLKQDENIENTYTAVMPYAVDSTGNAVVGDLQTVVVDSDPKILNLDLSSEFQTATETEVITVERLNELAQNYIRNNDIGVPKTSITVSFISLEQTEEYKDIAPLERVRLCDTVTVNYEKLGVSATAKVVRYEYNVLTERYNSIDIGDVRSSLASTIAGISQSVENTVQNAQGYLDGTIASFTNLIANGLGLFVTKEAVGETGGVKIYLHNRPTRSESQYQWTFNSAGFAVSTDYGQTWSAGIDAEGNAIFNSLSANIIRAMDIYGATISAGTMIFDPDGQPVTVKGSTLGSNDGVIFTGSGDFTVECATIGITGTGDSSGREEIQILGKDAAGRIRNMIQMTDRELHIMHSNANQNGVQISITDSNGLGIFFNGTGYDGLGFVSDGNGHMVLGK